MMLLAAALAFAAPVATPIADAKVWAISGTCRHFVIPAGDQSETCRPIVFSIAYSNNRTSFAVPIGDTGLVSFHGDNQPVDSGKMGFVLRQITIAQSSQDQARTVRATGACTYTDLFAGASQIECEASTAEGDFALSFQSDGAPPTAVNL
jgi:hypothetical protein